MHLDRARLLDPISTDIEYVVAAHGREINERACAALAACNGGRFPETFIEWRNVFLRLGIRTQIVSPEVLGEAVIRYDDEEKARGKLYLPNISNRRRLFFWLLHEASETAMKRSDIVPELHYPCEWGDHHTMACVVEWCHEQPIVLKGFLWEIDLGYSLSKVVKTT